MNGITDTFVRNSYFGGAVDCYKCYGKDLYYYDVNSLYPFAMLKPMPFNLIASYNGENCKNINLNTFFGFLHLDIECPDSISKPILPFKYKGKTIFPCGIWTSTYFSHAWQELKIALQLGHKIHKIHHAKEFSSEVLFNDYVQEMYQIKQNSAGHEKDG